MIDRVKELTALITQAQEEMNPGSSAAWIHEIVVVRDYAVVLVPMTEEPKEDDRVVGLYSNEPIGSYSEFWLLHDTGSVQVFPEAHPNNPASILHSTSYYGARVHPDLASAVKTEFLGE